MNTFCSSVLLASVLAVTGSAASAVAQERSYTPTSVTVPKGGTIIPMAAEGLRPVVEVYANGRGPFRFIVDTGGWADFITAKTASALGLGKIHEGDSTSLDLRIGNASFQGARFDVNSVLPGKLDGFIGLPLFKTILLTVDFPKREFRLAKGSLAAPDEQNILTLHPVGPLFAVKGNVAGRELLALIDTQGGPAWNADPETAKSLSWQAAPVPISVAWGPAFGKVTFSAARLGGDIAVGQYRFKTPIVSIAPIHVVGTHSLIMGMSALKNFAITLDQKNLRARFDAPATPFAAPPSLRDFGFAYMPSEKGNLQVVLVRSGSAAEHDGIAVGDDVVEIDGTPAGSLDSKRLNSMLSDDKPHTFLIQRGDAQVRIVLMATTAVT